MYKTTAEGKAITGPFSRYLLPGPAVALFPFLFLSPRSVLQTQFSLEKQPREQRASSWHGHLAGFWVQGLPAPIGGKLSTFGKPLCARSASFTASKEEDQQKAELNSR